MANQIRTWFDIPFPPFEEEKLKAGANTIRFALKGHIPSKKNNQEVRRCFDKTVSKLKELKAEFENGSKLLTPDTFFSEAMAAMQLVYIGWIGNDEYRKFVDDHKPSMLEQAAYWRRHFEHKGLIFPLSKAKIQIKFYFAKNYNHDTLNKMQSIQDLLTDCSIISDDNYKVLNPIIGKSKLFKNEVTDNLVEVLLTFNLKKNTTKDDAK